MTDVVLPGRAADSPQNDRVAPGRFRVRPDDSLAAGHRPAGALVPGRGEMTEHLQYHVVAPSAGATLTQHGEAGRPGPFCDAVVVHNSRAAVSQMDQMRASAQGFAPQLGAAAPSPMPGQPPIHTVATDGGAPFRGTAPQAAAMGEANYLTGPRGAH